LTGGIHPPTQINILPINPKTTDWPAECETITNILVSVRLNVQKALRANWGHSLQRFVRDQSERLFAGVAFGSLRFRSPAIPQTYSDNSSYGNVHRVAVNNAINAAIADSDAGWWRCRYGTQQERCNETPHALLLRHVHRPMRRTATYITERFHAGTP
jgi:hypothetical protein